MISDLYKALGLTPSASVEEIKKTYRQLAKEYHPDKNKNGAEKFKEISNAYSILIDPEKKRDYISKNAAQEGSSKAHRGFSANGFTAYDFTANGFNTHGSKGFTAGHNPFEQFFNASFTSEQSPPKKTPEDYDVRTSCKVTLEEIYNGSTIRISYKETRECPTCHGNPKQSTLKRTEKCKNCDGKGHLNRTVNQKMTGMKCHFCKGHGGKSFYVPCKDCHNEQYINKKVGVKLPKGVHDGHSLHLKNRGNLYPDKKTRGGLLIRIQEEPHSLFSRQGDHLYINVTLSLKEALLGFKNKVLCTHLDGRMLTATQPAGQVIKPGSKRLIKGEGMPIFNSTTGSCGDLLVTFQVEFPDTIQIPQSRESRLVVDSLFETEEDVQARENAIIIDDEDENVDSANQDENVDAAHKQDEPPINISDDDSEMKESESTAASVLGDPPEHCSISDANNSLNESDEFFSDDDFPHLFNVFL